MYANLKAEMARNSVTLSQLSTVIGVTLQTMSKKVNGASDFSLTEAYAIKDYLGVDAPIEELFKEVENV